MQELIRNSLSDAKTAVEQLLLPQNMRFIEQVGKVLAHRFREGSKLLTAGNGGSLCDAMHFAEELTGQFRSRRPALPAIALCDPSHLTCVGNDLGFESVFARGVEALGVEGDLFVGLTTSGNSLNLVKAFEVASQRGLITIAFLGRGGGMLRGVADLELLIDGFSTSDRVQEAHMLAIHVIIEVVESELFSAQPALV